MATMAAGWLNHQQIERDRDFESLRGRPDYKTLLERLKELPIDVQPTIGFQSWNAWTAAGEPLAVTLPASGERRTASRGEQRVAAKPRRRPGRFTNAARRYLLSTVLAVTEDAG
jgi:hypothetical protein